jgi:SAM-dependent methyltransferase
MEYSKEERLRNLTEYLCCIGCLGKLEYEESAFSCTRCKESYPIVDDIPRFVPESYYSLRGGRGNIEERTKDYFGYEWDYFDKWGFIVDEDVPQGREIEFHGGTVSATKRAFDSKCRLTNEELTGGKIVLDAGCGNGRYTHEVASRGSALIFGVDIGYGSVQSAKRNNKNKPNVFIIQASLLRLPFKSKVIDSCFSNGVLMHTGNAEQAFYEIARTIKNGGSLVVHLYHKLNPIWEFNDRCIRSITTRMSIENNMKLASVLARVSQLLDRIPYALKVLNLFFRLQPTVIHMYDWYSAQEATHHTYPELANWFVNAGFIVEDNVPQHVSRIWTPWGFNLKGFKRGGI